MIGEQIYARMPAESLRQGLWSYKLKDQWFNFVSFLYPHVTVPNIFHLDCVLDIFPHHRAVLTLCTQGVASLE